MATSPWVGPLPSKSYERSHFSFYTFFTSEIAPSEKEIRGCQPSSRPTAARDARVSGRSAGRGGFVVRVGVKCVKSDPGKCKRACSSRTDLWAAASMSRTEWFWPVPTFRTTAPAPRHRSASSTARTTSDTWVRSRRWLPSPLISMGSPLRAAI